MDSLYVHAHMIEDDDERDLVIADGVIADADPIPGTEPDASGWVLPGLVDVHNHLSLASPAGNDQDADVRVRASASVELALGVLAIREPGSPDDASARLAEEGGWPRVITAGRFLAPPGGYFPSLAREMTAAGDETSALGHLADAITRSRPQRGGHLWSHVWALTQAVPLARRAADPRAQPWHDEALTTAQRSGMRSLAGELRQLA